VIDFRYHLVSLVAVFLALAVGIVLGAGPLRETLGDSVTGRTAQLTAQNEQLRDERDAAVAERGAAAAALDAAGAGLVGGTLEGFRVAVVSLGEVPDEVRGAIGERLAQAGATVAVEVMLTPAWSAGEQRSYRQSLAGYLVGYLDPAPEADAGLAAELAQALVQGLVASDPAAPGEATENASLLLELLSTGDTPLVTLAAPPTSPVDAVVLVAPGAPQDASPPMPDPDATAAAVALLRAAQDRSSGAVLAEPGTGEGQFVGAVLAAGDAADLATVSGVDGVVGQLGVPLALAQRVTGTAGHYGPGGALTPLPPRTVARVPEPAAP